MYKNFNLFYGELLTFVQAVYDIDEQRNIKQYRIFFLDGLNRKGAFRGTMITIRCVCFAHSTNSELAAVAQGVRSPT